MPGLKRFGGTAAFLSPLIASKKYQYRTLLRSFREKNLISLDRVTWHGRIPSVSRCLFLSFFRRRWKIRIFVIHSRLPQNIAKFLIKMYAHQRVFFFIFGSHMYEYLQPQKRNSTVKWGYYYYLGLKGREIGVNFFRDQRKNIKRETDCCKKNSTFAAIVVLHRERIIFPSSF